MEKPDVALIQAPAWGVKCPPYGIAVLKAYLLSRGYKATAYDLNLELYLSAEPALKEQWTPDRDQFWKDSRLVSHALQHQADGQMDRSLEVILNGGARVVGFSTLYSNEAAGLIMARKIKAADPSRVIVFGGPQASRDAGGLELAASGCVDYVVEGEGEETFVELLRCLEKKRDPADCKGLLFKRGDRVVDTGDRTLLDDLSSSPFADYSDFDMRSYTEVGCLPVSLSRGCPNKCEFCYEVAYWRRFRARRADSLVMEIAFQQKVLPEVNWLWFHDSLVNGNMNQLKSFAQGLLDHDAPVRWASQAVLRKEMTREVLELLKRSGCFSLNYGLESASFAVMLRMGKVLAKGSDVDRVIRDTFEAGIDCVLNFMFGFPGETEEDFQITLDFVRRNKDYITMVQPSPGFCDFYKGTAGYKNPEKLGITLRDGSAHWVSQDGASTYLTRMLRFERFLEVVHGLGIRCAYPHKKLFLKNTIIGNYHHYYGDFEQAVAAYENALETDPPHLATLERLLDCYDRTGRHDRTPEIRSKLSDLSSRLAAHNP